MAVDEALTSASSITVRFWGVRGSIACPGPMTLRYGGNTPCVEIRCGSYTLIFDAGTGIRQLGNALTKAAITTDFDIFLSHGHIDHVVGLPFFAPLFVEGQIVRVWGALRILAPDEFPIYQGVPGHDGAVVATCHSGVSLAGAHALWLARDLVAPRLPDHLKPFHSRRFAVSEAA